MRDRYNDYYALVDIEHKDLIIQIYEEVNEIINERYNTKSIEDTDINTNTSDLTEPLLFYEIKEIVKTYYYCLENNYFDETEDIFTKMQYSMFHYFDDTHRYEYAYVLDIFPEEEIRKNVKRTLRTKKLERIINDKNL